MTAVDPPRPREQVATALGILGCALLVTGAVLDLHAVQAGGAIAAVLAMLTIPLAIWLDYRAAPSTVHNDVQEPLGAEQQREDLA